jgi:hypothetical protein
MVRVKNKPQHLVFCSHFGHLTSKPGHLPVESLRRPYRMRARVVGVPSDLPHIQGNPRGPIHDLQPLSKPSLWPGSAQGAESVHSYESSCAHVDKTGRPNRGRVPSALGSSRNCLRESAGNRLGPNSCRVTYFDFSNGVTKVTREPASNRHFRGIEGGGSAALMRVSPAGERFMV